METCSLDLSRGMGRFLSLGEFNKCPEGGWTRWAPIVVFDRYVDSFIFKRRLVDKCCTEDFCEWLSKNLPVPDKVFVFYSCFDSIDKRAKSLEKNKRRFDQEYKETIEKSLHFFRDISSRQEVVLFNNEGRKEVFERMIKVVYNHI